MSKIFWFHIDMNNYRSGTNIYTYEKPLKNIDENSSDEDDYASEEAVPYCFPLPKKYRIYIISEFPHYKIIGYIDTDKKEECKKLYLKMFSQLHECLPFEVTGYNCTYKEIGHYPKVPEYIKKMDDIDIIDKLDNMRDEVYFVFAIDKDGNKLFTEMLSI